MPETKTYKYDLYNQDLEMHPLYAWRILVETMEKNYNDPNHKIKLREIKADKKLTYALEALIERGTIKESSDDIDRLLGLTEEGRRRYRAHKKAYEEHGSYYIGHTV